MLYLYWYAVTITLREVQIELPKRSIIWYMIQNVSLRFIAFILNNLGCNLRLMKYKENIFVTKERRDDLHKNTFVSAV
jgi:hypothetical protein